MSSNNQVLKEKAAVISLAANIFLVLIKLFFAYFSNASLLVLDAIHSLVDSLSSLMVLGSVRISGMKSKRLSILLLQVENLASILISFIIFFGAYEVFKRALNPTLLFGGRVPSFLIAIVGVLISITVCYVVSKYKIHMGAKTGSQSLVADGCESQMDMYSSVVVLISLLGSMVGIGLNKLAGGVIALFIAKVGVDVFLRGVKAFMYGMHADMENAKNGGDMPQTVGLFTELTVDTEKYLQRIRSLGRYCLVVIAVLYLLSGVFVVQSDEQGVLRRFGREVKANIPPGLHYHLPYPIESVLKPKVTEVKRLELGFRYVKEPYDRGSGSELWESTHSLGTYQKVSGESLMITGDENIVDVNMIIQYRISDSSKFLFNARDPEQVVRDVAEASLRRVVGSKNIDEALTGGKMEIQDEVMLLVQTSLTDYDVGISVLTVQLQDVHPPTEVAEAFKDVASAREDKNKKIDDAKAYQNDVLPKARGDAARLVLEAEAYKANRIDMAEGESERFMKLLGEYSNYENTTRTRLYLEAMESVLPNVRLFVVDSDEGCWGRRDLYSVLLPLMDVSAESRVGPEPSKVSQDNGTQNKAADFGYLVLDEEALFARIDEKPTFL